eukprot:comp12835_c0_seq1/m.17184 comp12835_c0_seq1/g.17184  ORF comp12835_c0_seq1/g.17184 comp12835_c0_seq1/m.17184 type:complete len:114 (+) comp12835_c0_seq1:143-484(+)
MRFCDECNNMLFPEEDRMNKRLIYRCRTCNIPSDDVKDWCVYRNIIKGQEEVNEAIPDDLADDPTLPRAYNSTCKSCGNTETVFFQASNEAAGNRMVLTHICRNPQCRHKWTE